MSKINIIAESNNSTVVTEYKSLVKRSDSYQSEDALEKEFIKSLCEQGYEYLTIHKEDELISNLKVKLENLNNYQFSDNEWKMFFDTVIANKMQGIVEKTRTIQEDHIKVLKTDSGLEKNIYLIDKKNIHNNSLQVINQYEVEGNYKNRYDVTILVNGLPLVHIELKRRGIQIREAFNQIERYQRDSFWADNGLFEYVQLFVISNGTSTKYYSNTTRDNHVKNEVRKKSNTFEFTNYWADSKNVKILDLLDFTRTFFTKHALLNILTKYCVFTSEESLLVMRPYQIAATEMILNRIEIAHNYKNQGKVEAGGYVWHTTGSGKTLTSFKTALLCSNKEYINKVIFVVDRKDLDYQTMKEYDKFQKGAANSNGSTKVLTKQLEDTNSKIIITTIQKLDNFVKKNKGHNIFNQEVVLIFDECHRSQFGEMHKSIVKNFKKYYLFGFTGTPIFPVNRTSGSVLKTTEQLFGDKLHTYTIMDAINDNNVLEFKFDYVKSITEKDNITDKEVSAIDKNEAFNNPIRIHEITKYIIDNFARKTKTSESFVHKSIDNVVSVAKSKKHQEKFVKRNVNGFNSMLACSSVETAKMYYDEFKNIDNNLKVAIIYSYGVNDELNDGLSDENNESIGNLDKSSRDFLELAIQDYNGLFNTSYDTSSEKFQNYYKDVSLRMKNREIDILIVANMFLTGFDAPTLNTIWVDKNLKYHGLIQAFSRTNRILNRVKTHGNIVCFRNLENELNDAIKLFGNKDSKGIILMKTYEEYYFGYESEVDSFKGYLNLVNELRTKYPLNQEIIGEQNQKDFIKIYSEILKVRNILDSFDEFENDKLLSPRELQDFQSRYLDVYHEFRNKDDVQKESIIEDVVFELELIKQIEVNIDYILELIHKYHDGNMQDEEILMNIKSSISASISLRNKKDLIEEFIASLSPESNVFDSFEEFINEKKKEELDKLIIEESLKQVEAYAFLEEAFKRGVIESTGIAITKLLPPVSRFTPNNASLIKKNIVIDKLNQYFDKFYEVSYDRL